MTILDIIAKKRDGQELEAEEIHFAVNGYTQGAVADYQMSALLMAIYLRGMTVAETTALLHAMLHSGEIIDLGDIAGPRIDKHSTGGVGDKVSLILAPLLAAAGVTVPMISGRGLAHTGGTLDKLESIPGFRCALSVDEFKAQLNHIGVAMIGQTERIVPADKKIYALRDATATIASLPLITASILSKKLAEGITGLVLDVKTGQGGFMKNQQQAETLAASLVNTASSCHLPATALLTRMDEPLGNTIGNWLEVQETVQALQGQGAADLMEVTLALGVQMLHLADSKKNQRDLESLLSNGDAFKKFMEMVVAQGGKVDFLLEQHRYPKAKFCHVLHSPCEGYIQAIDACTLGHAAVRLGAGRYRMEDVIDPKAGIRLLKKCGDVVKLGEDLAILYSDDPGAIGETSDHIIKAYTLGNVCPQPTPMVLKVMHCNMKDLHKGALSAYGLDKM